MTTIDLTDLQSQRLNDVKNVVDCVIDGIHRKAKMADEDGLEEVRLSVVEAFHVLDAMNFIRSFPMPHANAVEIPDGFALVPKEPTVDMLTAAWNAAQVGRAPQEDRAVWAAMLEAAPKVPSTT